MRCEMEFSRHACDQSWVLCVGRTRGGRMGREMSAAR